MNITGLSESDLEIIEQELKARRQIHCAWLFGSRAIGKFKPGSDVDIAISGDIDLTVISDLKDILEERCSFPYTFDIINFDTITNESLTEHIKRFGVKIK